MVGGRQVGLAVVGLGRAFTLMLPTFGRDDRFRLAAATTPGAEAHLAFTAEFDAPTYENVEALCRDPDVEAVYVASPHQFHAEHVELAARAGKHILVEKPLAVTLAEGKAMVAAAKAAGVQMVVGPSHGFDAPVRRAREIIAGGTVGRLRMIHALNYTDFLYRPRRPEELDTAQGGGVVFSQAVHQVDVARLLGGGMVRTVRAITGNWDPARPTEGAYSLQLDFEDGAFASLTYSGYGRFDSDEFMGWRGELGQAKGPADYGKARRALGAAATAADEVALKRRRAYGRDGVGLSTESPPPAAHEHFGAWGLATLEVCLAILQSAREGRAIAMKLQVPAV
jgi:phthalate 4,5-cis-dihydrodiol dehydrogenase